jgi:dihydrodipicolinate synthase/N-acetylneuraminate lyase
LEEHNVIGIIKENSIEINRSVKDADEAMWLSAHSLGTEAFIPGFANAFPEICQKMYQEGMAGDYEAYKNMQFEVNQMWDIMYLVKSKELAIYAMLEIRGIVTCYPRASFIPATEGEKQKSNRSYWT